MSLESIRTQLSGMTVKGMKEVGTSYGVKCPSLNKDELLNWLSATLYERSVGVNQKDTGYKISFDRVMGVNVSRSLDTQDWLTTLRDHGVVSVKIKDFDPSVYRAHFWNWITTSSPQVTEHDRSHWDLKFLPPSTRGIFKNYIGHQEWMWEGREKCHPIFKTLWGTDNLLCSFDGASVIFPPKETVHSFKNWFHYDQGRFNMGLCSIQGIVHLTDTDDLDGGFCFVENSHLLHSKYAETHPSWGYKWEVIDIDSPVFSGCRLFKPQVKAGEILLFDSRLAHCFIPSRSNNYRMVMYVCMMPRSGATQKEIEKRQKLYIKNDMTGHWCYGPWFDKTDSPYTPGRVQITPPSFIPPTTGLSPLRLSMIGI